MQKGADSPQLNPDSLVVRLDGSLYLNSSQQLLNIHSLEQIDNVNKVKCDVRIANNNNSVGFRTGGKMSTLLFNNNLEMKLVTAVIYRGCIEGLEERTRQTLYMN